MATAEISKGQMVSAAGRMDALSTNLFEWRQLPTPDLMGAFTFALQTAAAQQHEAKDGVEGMSNDDITIFMNWLRSDSLDWEGVERRDAWSV